MKKIKALVYQCPISPFMLSMPAMLEVLYNQLGIFLLQKDKLLSLKFTWRFTHNTFKRL